MAESPEPPAGDLVEAVEVLSEVFDARGIRYALLGGLATILRGRPRFTQGIRTILAANATDLDVDLIRREWAAVAHGEEERTAWLDAALEAVRRT